MALFRLPSSLSHLQQSTIPFKILESSMLFCGISWYYYTQQGWGAQAKLWLSLAWIAYPLIFMMLAIIRITFVLLKIFFSASEAIFGRLARRQTNLFNAFIDIFYDLLESAIDAHNRLIAGVWLLPTGKNQQALYNVTHNTNVINMKNNGPAYLSGVQVGNNSGNASTKNVGSQPPSQGHP